MGKKFISFLGNSKYSEMTYSFNGKRVDASYVQEAMLQLVCNDYSEQDTAYILVTDDAWNRNGETLQGLLNNNSEIKCQIRVKNIELPIEKSDNPEAGVWHLFDIIYEILSEEDAITVDITNAFRYFPVIMMSVLNYAQYLKNITINGIYYGAYEQRYPLENEKFEIEPIIDLTKTYELMNWASAANTFTSYGIPTELYKQIKKKDNEIEAKANNLSSSILRISNDLNYSRGGNIVTGENFIECKNNINKYKEDERKKNPALLPILDSVLSKVKDFDNGNELNFMYAVDLYLQYDRPAEAISMLKEGIITLLLQRGNLDWENYVIRNLFGKRLSYRGNFDYNNNEIDFKEKIEKIINTPMARELKSCVEEFSTIRNDIDHSGFCDSSRKPGDIKKGIIKAVDKVKEILERSPNNVHTNPKITV